MPHRLIISWSPDSNQALATSDDPTIANLIAQPGVRQARVFHAADGVSDVMLTLDFADHESIDRYLESLTGSGAGSSACVTDLPGMRVWATSPRAVSARRSQGGALL